MDRSPQAIDPAVISTEANDVEIDIGPLKVKGYRLAEESLELIAKDVEDRFKSTWWMSTFWTVCVTVGVERFILLDMASLGEAQTLVLNLIFCLSTIGGIITTIRWFMGRTTVENIIKKRTKSYEN